MDLMGSKFRLYATVGVGGLSVPVVLRVHFEPRDAGSILTDPIFFFHELNMAATLGKTLSKWTRAWVPRVTGALRRPRPTDPR